MALIEKLNAIGDAIREKTGGTEKMTLVEMAEAIKAIETGGGDGGSVETCTVTITSRTAVNYLVVTILDPSTGEMSCENVGAQGSGYSRTFENVVCGSPIAIYPSGAALVCETSGGITTVANYMSFVLAAPSESGAIASALFYSNA